jgi:glycosyltransferase involved in cell wall biosynthesis
MDTLLLDGPAFSNALGRFDDVLACAACLFLGARRSSAGDGVNILFLDQFNGLGGGQQCLRDLIPGIIGQRWTAHVGLPVGGPLSQEISESGGIVHEMQLEQYSNGRKSITDKMRFVREAPVLARKIRRLVNRHQIDLVYVNGPRLLPAAALAADKLVFHSHSLISGRYITLLAGMSLRRSGATVIASSSFVAEPLRSHVPRERLRIVYNGVRDYGVRPCVTGESHTPRVGLIGRIAPEKGQLDLVEVARSFVNDGRPCEFVICGDSQHSEDSYLSKVRESAEGLPIKLLPWQADVGPTLRSLDVVVLPSRAVDATPRVIPEAFSAGVPVVAYPSGGLPELIQHGTNGILTSEPSPQSLARALRSLLADREQMARLGRTARQCYLSRFTVERFREEVVEVLARI